MREVTRIHAYMRKEKNGIYVTDVLFNGVVVNTVPTSKCQIRKKRVSLLWKPGVDPEFTRVV